MPDLILSGCLRKFRDSSDGSELSRAWENEINFDSAMTRNVWNPENNEALTRFCSTYIHHVDVGWEDRESARVGLDGAAFEDLDALPRATHAEAPVILRSIVHALHAGRRPAGVPAGAPTGTPAGTPKAAYRPVNEDGRQFRTSRRETVRDGKKTAVNRQLTGRSRSAQDLEVGQELKLGISVEVACILINSSREVTSHYFASHSRFNFKLLKFKNQRTPSRDALNCEMNHFKMDRPFSGQFFGADLNLYALMTARSECSVESLLFEAQLPTAVK
ncbi:hypothetical protein B0H17DRAFT_1149688 [Mycena rosella]|uniref:Uncharacterized protein n=1 Tax=Mycena rosella TaxID=1033263 RepID=A0AAD7FSX3_MYCRO|nr:hypothetical protein B0H17DRAFT_1149688 [Mycena rosella]